MTGTPGMRAQAEAIRTGKAATVAAFLDWLIDEQHLQPCRRRDDDGEWTPDPRSREEIADAFLGIDRAKLEEERQDLLQVLREANGSRLIPSAPCESEETSP